MARKRGGALTAQTEPIHVVAARKARLEQRRALLDEHYPWDEDKGVRRDAETGEELRPLTRARVVQARSLPPDAAAPRVVRPLCGSGRRRRVPQKDGDGLRLFISDLGAGRSELRVNRKSARVAVPRFRCASCARGAAAARRDVQPRPPGPGRRSKTLWLPLARAPSAVKTCVEIKQWWSWVIRQRWRGAPEV